MSDLEPCPDCAEEREAKDPCALNCHTCKGTGFRRKLSSYKCNRCAGTLIPPVYKHGRYDHEWTEKDSDHHMEPYGLIDAGVSGGYSSHYLHDCTNYNFSLCEKCLRELFTSFKIPPRVTGYPRSDEETYADDLEAHHRRLWKQSEGARARFQGRLCNYEESCTNKASVIEFCSESITDRLYCPEHEKSGCQAVNNRAIPVHLLEGVPYISAYDGTYTREQCLQMTRAWLVTLGEPMLYLRHLTGEIDLLLGFDQHTDAGQKEVEKYSAFWTVDGAKPSFDSLAAIALIEVESPMSLFREIKLDGGTLYVGPQKECQRIASMHSSWFADYYRIGRWDMKEQVDALEDDDSGPVHETSGEGSEEPGV